MIRLRHEISDDGVTLCFGSQRVRVTETEAKRFAWGILADLDPDETVSAGGELPPVAHVPSEVRRGGRRAKGPSQVERVLTAISGGASTTAQVALATGLPSGVVAARVSAMQERGLVLRANPYGPGAKAEYVVTAAGRQHLGVQ